MKLPLHCDADYLADFISVEEANSIFKVLSENPKVTAPHTVLANNTNYVLNYGKVMFMDSELKNSGQFPEAIWSATEAWPEVLMPLKSKIESLTGLEFRTCVCIYYPDGNSGVDYHSDYSAFGDTNFIPSISLGEERVFKLRRKTTGEEYEISLANGSLLIMGDKCQENYEHALPVDSNCKNARINLTFRILGFKDK